MTTLDECIPKWTGKELAHRNDRVLIVAPSFRHYGEMIQGAFTQLGWNAVLCEQTQIQLTMLNAVRWSVSSAYRTELRRQSGASDARKLMKKAAQFDPRLIVFINGDGINKDDLDTLSEAGASLVLWCYDSVSRYPHILDNVSTFDYVFIFEPTDATIISSHGVKNSVLPMGYDPTCYFPITETARTIDVSFVGTLFSYPDRMHFLKEVVFMNPSIRTRIFTNTPPSYSPKRICRLLAPFSSFLKTVEMGTMDHSQVNGVYNASRICLNIHHGQSREGLNPRVFEILGSGAFQLVDHKAQLSDFFTLGKEVVCYDSVSDLHEKIRYFLENPLEREDIAIRGHEAVRVKHTYRHRLEELLNRIEL